MIWIFAALACRTPVPEPAPVPAPAPVVVAPEPTGPLMTKGESEKDHIRRVVALHKQEMEYCYSRELAKNPKLEGKVSFAFEVTAGVVSDVSIKQSTLENAEAEACMQVRIEGWLFDPGLSTTVSYPFVFGPVSKEEEGSE